LERFLFEAGDPKGANMHAPPEWVFHVLTWTLAAIGLLAIAHIVPWPVIE
jgi:hypothetical protein